MKITKMRVVLGLTAGVAMSAACLAVLPAAAAHAQEASNPPVSYFDPSSLPDLGTCQPMAYGYSVNPNRSINMDYCVGALQESLVAVGFTTLSVDGEYGPQTWSDVWNFQFVHQLSATGNADAQTIALLDQIANSPAAETEDNGAEATGGGELQPLVPPVPITYVDNGGGDEHPEAPDVTVPEDPAYVP